MRIFAYLGGEGGNRIVMIFCIEVGVPDLITYENFWWRSVQAFLRERGSNFPLFHWLALSSLKHSGTTVPACDVPGRRQKHLSSHLYGAVVFALTVLIVIMINSFVVVAVEADTVVAVIVSGVLTVQAVSVLNVVGALYSRRNKRYKNVLPQKQYVTWVLFTETAQQQIWKHKTREYKKSCTLPVGYRHH